MNLYALHDTGTEISSGVGPTFNLGANTIVGFFTNVSDVEGTDAPTLTLKLQHSPNQTDWYDVEGMPSAVLTTVGLTQTLPPANPLYFTNIVRIVWTITGTSPSFTFETVVGNLTV
jgi:hypothetical protein